jgi:hypothetical protein
MKFGMHIMPLEFVFQSLNTKRLIFNTGPSMTEHCRMGGIISPYAGMMSSTLWQADLQ